MLSWDLPLSVVPQIIRRSGTTCFHLTSAKLWKKCPPTPRMVQNRIIKKVATSVVNMEIVILDPVEFSCCLLSSGGGAAPERDAGTAEVHRPREEAEGLHGQEEERAGGGRVHQGT